MVLVLEGCCFYVLIDEEIVVNMGFTLLDEVCVLNNRFLK